MDASVWALQTGEGRRYARVNTAIGELDTVRSVSNPDRRGRADAGSYLFSDELRRSPGSTTRCRWTSTSRRSRRRRRRRPGTTERRDGGDFVAYRTDSGAVFVGLLGGTDVTQLDPFRIR